MTPTANAYNRAILVSLTISSWSARKYDKDVTKDALDAHNASEDGGRFNKYLLPGTNVKRVKKAKKKGQEDVETQAPNSFKALTQHIAETRAMHYRETLPWTDDGWRMLPIKNYQNYVDLMNDAQHKFYRLLEEFVTDYPALRAQAQVLLNGMFNADEYPTDVRERFAFAYVPRPVPNGADYRVELGEEEIARIARMTEDRTKQAVADAQADVVKRLHKVVAKIHERLATAETCKDCNGKGQREDVRKNPTFGKLVKCWTCEGAGNIDGVICGTCQGYKVPCTLCGGAGTFNGETCTQCKGKPAKFTKTEDTRPLKNDGTVVTCWICDGTGKKDATFRDTLVENAREVVDVLTRINMDDDATLEGLRQRTDKLIANTDAEQLRDDDNLRKSTADEAQAILDAMTATYGNLFNN